MKKRVDKSKYKQNAGAQQRSSAQKKRAKKAVNTAAWDDLK